MIPQQLGLHMATTQAQIIVQHWPGSNPHRLDTTGQKLQ